MPIVLGGGISGLSVAYFLLKQQIQPITLFEATNRLGGWLKTHNHSDQNFLFELGPRTIRPAGHKGKLTLQLIDDLQLSTKIIPITANHAAAKNRLIYVDKKLCLLPGTFLGLLKTYPPFKKPLITALINDIKTGPSGQPLSDETIYDFTSRRFGEEVAKYAISSMICGICAGDAREISVKFLMDDLFRKEQKYGGVVKAMLMSLFDKTPTNNDYFHGKLVEQCNNEKWSIYSLKDGIEELPKSLENYLRNQNVTLATKSECQRIWFDKNHITLTVNGQNHKTDQLISSLPSYRLATLLAEQHPILASELNQISYVDVAVINLQYSTANLLKRPAFGFLVPPCENLPILGVIYDSCCFDMPGNTVLTVMMGGKWFEEKLGKNPTDDILLSIAIKQVGDILKINESPKKYQVSVHRKCIPQYVLGHSDRVNRIREYVVKNKMPLYLCGSCYDGVGVNDVIYSAKQAALTMIRLP